MIRIHSGFFLVTGTLLAPLWLATFPQNGVSQPIGLGYQPQTQTAPNLTATIYPPPATQGIPGQTTTGTISGATPTSTVPGLTNGTYLVPQNQSSIPQLVLTQVEPPPPPPPPPGMAPAPVFAQPPGTSPLPPGSTRIFQSPSKETPASSGRRPRSNWDSAGAPPRASCFKATTLLTP